MNKVTNSKIITNVTSIRNKEINERQVKMIRDLDDMGLLVTPSFNLKCSPSAYFQPRNN